MEQAGSSAFTPTVCGMCSKTSEVNEGMICCDSCHIWFHYRCVGVTTADAKKRNWFCLADACQQKYEEHKKKQEAAKKAKKKALDDSDRSSSKSENQSGSVLERKLKALEHEQKAKEEEIEVEQILMERRMQMERVLKEKKRQMENDIRAKEMLQEKELLQKALLDEKAHLDKMKFLRKSFEDEMEIMKKEEAIFKATRQSERSKRGKKVPLEDIAKDTPLRNPDAVGSTRSEKQGNSSVTDRNKYATDTEHEDWTAGESEISSHESEFSNECDQFEDHGEETEEKDKKQVGPRHLGPSKAQLSARHGITKKLPIFTGKPEEWPLFIGSYQASNEACGFSDVENLVRLQESLRCAALESVRGQLLLPKSVPKVISKLRQLYGRPEQLLQCHLEKIRKLDSPKAEKLSSFIPFGNAVEQLCDHLEAAELTQHMMNPLLIQDLVDKLPANDKREWVRCKKRKKTVTLRTFADFLAKIVDEACEANVSFDYKPIPKPSKSGQSNRVRTKEKESLYFHGNPDSSNANAETKRKPKPCRACNRTDHRLRFCQDFKNRSIVDRKKTVEKWKLCPICLNDHGNAVCKFNIRCNIRECRERHNTLLHPAAEDVVINAHIKASNSILFRILPVTLYFGERAVNTLAFLDEGASVTLVEKSLAAKLDVQGVQEKLTIKWTSDVTRIENDSVRMNLWISAQNDEKKMLIKCVRTVGDLLLPEQSFSATDASAHYSFLRGLPLASYDSQRPGILIGLNNLHVFPPIESRFGQAGEPIAVRSQLGWTVYGPKANIKNEHNFLGLHQPVSNEDLYDLLKSYYTLEESSATVVLESVDEKRAREILERTTVRVGDRFETGLLWKDDNHQFPDSYPMAFRRLKQLEQRLAKTPELYRNVCNQIEEYQQKGYAHKATEEELSRTDPLKVWYLPLNVVLHPKKPGKVRLVWDAAATVNGVSLNSQLLKGPDMLTPLTKVIHRFRERRVAFGGDIREMYHQLRIRQADKQAQRFLFRSDPNNHPTVYVMDVATFGSTSSPCSAQFVKNLNAMEFCEQYPAAVKAIVDKHYVDDYYDSVDSIEEAVQRANEVRLIHSNAGFEIRNWVSNSEEVLLSLGESKVEKMVHLNRDKTTQNERVLGIIWNPDLDVFSFSTDHRDDLIPYLHDGEVPTKRIVLSCVMGFFDPQGLLAPFTKHGRMLVQDLWRTGCQWDEKIDDESLTKWRRWTSLLPQVEDVLIPRCYFGDIPVSAIDSLELHVFTDASEHAYGCVTYLRAVTSDGIRCSLVMSKTKIAPLKRQSIPRLELMAAVLGARALQTILSNLSLHIKQCFLWTDSQTVLSWIRSDQRNYKQFVGFRIGEISELTNIQDWRWVPTKINIADVLTKWGQGPPLESNGPWFKGPQILYEDEERWPTQNLPASNAQEEIRASLLYHEISDHDAVIDSCRVSSWTRLLRIAATVFRFIENCRCKKAGLPIVTIIATKTQEKHLKINRSSIQLPLQQEELQKAELLFWRQAQQECFPDEYKTLVKSCGTAKPELKMELFGWVEE